MIHILTFILCKINSLKHRLTRVREILSAKHPNCVDMVPPEDSIDTDKLKDATAMTDTCAAAQKLRRILTEKIPGLYDYDCMQHLRNVWFGAMEKKLTKKLNEMLRADIDEIDPKLRVTASISAIIRAVDKEFSLSANYPKGHGEMFLEWMRANHPGELLLHVERASGSRQDLCTEGCLPIIMNYPYYIEFLDTMLRKKGKKNQKPSILQRNLFVVLTSSEMIALVRLLSIFHLSICMPVRWLAGKTHELAEYNWGPMSMGRVLDSLEKAMVQISKDPKLLLDEGFMMNIFSVYQNELPPFKEYLDLMYKKKSMRVVARKSGAKVVHLAKVRKCLFNPKNKTERKTSPRVIELASVAANAILTELRDPKKATFKYLSASKSKYCWSKCTDAMKKAMLGCKATNDEAESALGGTTSQIQQYGRIALSSASAISDIRRNGFLHRKTKSKNDDKSEGMFHQFPEEVRHAIILAAMEDAPVTRERNNADLAAQAKAKREKEEIAKEKNMEKASDEFIESTYLIRMYNSDACMKDDPKNVTDMLKKLTSKAAKLRALKTNISIRVKGFNWEWCHHAWSKNGVEYSVKVLANHLRMIIRKEKTGKYKIPTEAIPNVPQRYATGKLGTQTDFVKDLDVKYTGDEEKFKEKARAERKRRERVGDASMYSRLQPFYRPELCDLYGKRIDYLASFKIEGAEDELRWCQGEVTKVYDDKRQPTVRVLWDEMTDVDKGGEQIEGDIILLPSKWNKDKEKAWRMDIDIEVEEEEDEETIESESEDESEVEFSDGDGDDDGFTSVSNSDSDSGNDGESISEA